MPWWCHVYPPVSGVGCELHESMNDALSSEPPLGVNVYDTLSLIAGILSGPSSYGLNSASPEIM